MQHMYIKCLITWVLLSHILSTSFSIFWILYLPLLQFFEGNSERYLLALESFQTISFLSYFINIMLHHSFWCTLPNLNHIWLFTKLLTNQWQNNIIDLHYVSQGYFKMFILFLGFVSFPSSKDFLDYIDQRNSWEWLQKTFLIVA